jgi:two-component system response regulator DegU
VDGREGIRILLADEHSLFLESLKVVLEREPDLRVVAEAENGPEAVEEAMSVRPHVAVVSASLPGYGIVEAAALIRERSPESKLLVLSGEDDPELLIKVIDSGASGYLSKECPLTELIEAVRAVYRGDVVIPGRLLAGLLSHLTGRRQLHDEAFQRMTRLTRREREVLALLAEGADNRAIAASLYISPQTARTHIQNVLGKLEVHSRLEAAAFAMQHGILGGMVGVQATA